MKSVIEHLTHLVDVNRDAEAGFRAAAEGVENTQLQTQFANYASRHAEFASELNAEIQRLSDGSESESSTSGSVGNAIHQGWLDLKSMLSGHSAGNLISACSDGEESAYVAYLDAVDAIGSGQTHTLLRKQVDQITEFRTRLTRLTDQARHGVEFQKNE